MNELERMAKIRRDVARLYRNAPVHPSKQMFLESYFGTRSEASVLDVGFYGQGFKVDQPEWPHNLIRNQVRRCVGIDISPEVENLRSSGLIGHRMSAEDFHLNESFDVIHAGDVVEHLSNPGKLLECSLEHLAEDGEIVVSTPNPYFLTFVLQKLTYRLEPSVNPEHTCFFNVPTFAELASRYGLKIARLELLRRLGTSEQPGVLMRIAHGIHYLVSFLNKKFAETFVFILIRE